MMRYLIILSLVFFLNACSDEKDSVDQPADSVINNEQTLTNQPNGNDTAALTENKSEKTPEFTVETFENAKNEWGYRIMQADQIFINQPHIPAVSGRLGFQNEREAESVGNLVVHKLESGEMPPSVTREELDSLNISYTNSF